MITIHKLLHQLTKRDDIEEPANLSSIQYVNVQLNNAQIKALKASPIILIPAPGPGLRLAIHGFYGVSDTTNSRYNLNGGSPGISFFASDTFTSLTDYLTGSDQLQNFYTGMSGIQPVNEPEDLPLQLINVGDVELAGGDPANTLSLRIWFSTVPTVPFGA